MYSRLTPSFSSPSPRAPLQKVNSFIPVPREHYMHELFIPKHRLASNCFNKCVWYCKKQLDVLLKPHAWLYSRLQTSVWVAWHTTSALCVCVCCGSPSGIASNHRCFCRTTLRFTSKIQAKKKRKWTISFFSSSSFTYNCLGSCAQCEIAEF